MDTQHTFFSLSYIHTLLPLSLFLLPDEFCDNQGYCRRRFNGDRGNDRGVCDYKQCTKKSNQDLCQCNLNNSRCEKGSKVPPNTCDFIENTDENGCCIPGAGANMFLADEIQDQDFGEEE